MLLHFELTFITGKPMEKTAEGAVYDGPKEFKRVVVADDHDTATEMAEAMLGEEIASNQVLEKVKGVRYTSAQPTMGRFDAAVAAWNSVIAKMNLKEGAIKTYRNDAYGYDEIVGFTKVKRGR